MKLKSKFPIFGNMGREHTFYKCMTRKVDMDDMYDSEESSGFIKIVIGALIIGIVFLVIGYL